MPESAVCFFTHQLFFEFFIRLDIFCCMTAQLSEAISVVSACSENHSVSFYFVFQYTALDGHPFNGGFFVNEGLQVFVLCESTSEVTFLRVFLLSAHGSLLFILSSAAVIESNTCFLASGLALDSLVTYVP